MALYHKHRPQLFAEMIGQDHIVKTITNQIKGERIAHAYLFSGERGIGKTTAARLLSKAVNCTDRKKDSAEPCNKCEICLEISGSASIDVIEIDAASHTGVDNVRENIIENAQFRPTKSKYKVFIVDEAHMLSTPAFNALLKILEEPPEYVIFILATTEYHKLPETIISRCQRFNFKKVSYDDMSKQLSKIAKQEGIKIDKDVLERIINKGDGCVRDGVSLLDQIMATGEKHITAEIASIVLPNSNMSEVVDFLEALISKDTKTSLEKINQLSDDGVDMAQFATDVIEILRIMLISQSQTKLSSTGADISKETEKRLLKLYKIVEPADIVNLIDLFLKRKTEIKMHTIPQLPLELAVIEWTERDGNKNNDNNHDNAEKKESESTTESTDTKESTDSPASASMENEPEKIEVAKKTIKEKIKNIVHKESTLTIEQIKDKWHDFIKNIENQSASLSFIIKTASIDKISGNTLTILVNFSLHRDKLMSVECRKTVELALENVYGEKIKLEVGVTETETKPEPDAELQDLTAAFGGEVIN